MQPKKIGRIKRFLDAAKSRRNARKRGAIHPDAEMISRLAKAILRKQRPNATALEQNLELLKYGAIIAEKYSLDAIGLSPKYDAKKRTAVHKAIAENFAEAERHALLHTLKEERQTQLADSLFGRLESILGQYTAHEFILDFFPRLFEVASKLNDLMAQSKTH